MLGIGSRTAEAWPALALLPLLLWAPRILPERPGAHEEWLWRQKSRAWGPGVFLLSSAGEVKGLDEKGIDSTGKQVVVHLLSTSGICFLQLWDHL